MSHVKNLRYLAEMYADKALRDAADHIEHLEAEVHRLRHFAWVVEEHAENLVNESACALASARRSVR